MQIKHSFLLFVLLLMSAGAISQECGNCREQPSVAQFDFDIKVKEPEANSPALDSWRQLFRLARFANSSLFQANSSCVRFTQPSSQPRVGDAEGAEILRVGALEANVPSSGNQSGFGNYLVTGTVSSDGTGALLHMEIQAACTRKKVAAVDLPFNPAGDMQYIESIAQQAASQLSPLIDKIKAFELQERKERTDFSLGVGVIKMNVITKALMKGQSTNVIVELTDCDGTALPGRKIVFTGTKKGGPGTIGGIVTPATVITDANGNATVKFTMTASPGDAAIINALSFTQTGKACETAILGSVKVDHRLAYKVEIGYKLTGTQGMTMNSNEDRVIMRAGSGRCWEVAYQVVAFYYPPVGQSRDQQIMMMSDDIENPSSEFLQPPKEIEIAPLMYFTKGTRFGQTFIYYSGLSEMRSWDKPLSLEASPLGMTDVKDPVNEGIVSDKPTPPGLSMMFKGNELIFFSSSFQFPTDALDRQAPAGDFSIALSDTAYLPLKPQKITDPGSPYKSYYFLEYNDNSGYGKTGAMYKADEKIVSRAIIRIYSPY